MQIQNAIRIAAIGFSGKQRILLNLKQNRHGPTNYPMKLNSFYKVWMIGFLTALILLCYSYLYSRIDFLQENFKDPPFSRQIWNFDTSFSSSAKYFMSEADRIYLLNEIVDSDDYVSTKNDTISSMPLSISSEIQLSEKIQEQEDRIKLNSFRDSTVHYSEKPRLGQFFKKLEQAESTQVRIGYWGDSMIEGDLITSHLRHILQTRYGGSGVGWVPITSIVNHFRITVFHEFSAGWLYHSVKDTDAIHFPLGISGEVFAVDTNCGESPSITYRTSSKFPGVNQFSRGFLYYGSTGRILEGMNSSSQEDSSNWIEVKSSGIFRKIYMSSHYAVNRIPLFDQPVNKVELVFHVLPVSPVFGVSFESETGVLIDNFALRGISGTLLRKIKPDIIQGFQTLMDYDLIVLHFGTNVLDEQIKNYSWYRRGMTRVIRHFQKSFPNTPILIVGVADKAIKVENEMRTIPELWNLVKAQREAAMLTHSAFLDLFSAMGGEGSMVDWVEKKEWANKDYTHFNHRGSRRIASILADFLTDSTDDYKPMSSNGIYHKH